MISRKRPESVTRINTRLETFLAKHLDYENIEFYEQEPCVEDFYQKKNVLKKYAFRLLIVCKDRIYVTDNPPKNLDNFICFEDILDIKTVIFSYEPLHPFYKIDRKIKLFLFINAEV